MEEAKRQVEKAHKEKVRKPMSTEARTKLSKAMKAYYAKPENRAKITAGWTPAMRTDMRKRAKAYWTKGRREQASLAAKEMWSEFRQWQAEKKRSSLQEVKSA